jgi:hypothetical protein
VVEVGDVAGWVLFLAAFGVIEGAEWFVGFIDFIGESDTIKVKF